MIFQPGTDDLIGVLENASRTYSEEEIATDVERAKTVHFEALANLTYRESSTVRALAEGLGFTIKVTVRQIGGSSGGGRGYHVEVLRICKGREIVASVGDITSR